MTLKGQVRGDWRDGGWVCGTMEMPQETGRRHHLCGWAGIVSPIVPAARSKGRRCGSSPSWATEVVSTTAGT